LAVCGAGHRSDVVHLGTAAGVFRGQRQPNASWQWQPYNDGLRQPDFSSRLGVASVTLPRFHQGQKGPRQ
jgi:hypothetical protein